MKIDKLNSKAEKKTRHREKTKTAGLDPGLNA